MIASLNEYLASAKTTALYPKAKALEYVILGLTGEIGEIAEKIAKLPFNASLDPVQRKDLSAELGDVCWYLIMLTQELGIDPNDIVLKNKSLREVIHLPLGSFPASCFIDHGFLVRNVLELTGVAGSIANKYKKVLRGDAITVEQLRPFFMENISKAWNLVADQSTLMNTELYAVCQDNITKLLSRMQRSVIKGSGDNR